MKKIILSFILVSPLVASAKVLSHHWLLKKGQLNYHVSYPLKTVHGHTTQIKGKGQCDEKECRFLVAIPVRSFDSGDGNRDSRMLEVTRASQHPLVSAKVTLPYPEEKGKAAQVELTFAGVEKKIQPVSLSTEFHDGTALVKGGFTLLLSDFNIERPHLLGVSIEDSVPIDFEMQWVQEEGE